MKTSGFTLVRRYEYRRRKTMKGMKCRRGRNGEMEKRKKEKKEKRKEGEKKRPLVSIVVNFKDKFI